MKKEKSERERERKVQRDNERKRYNDWGRIEKIAT